MKQTKLKQLSKLVENPSGWDSLSNYAGEVPEDHWGVLLTKNRDSDLLTEHNFDSALESLGGEIEGEVEVFRFGHWACGWWEALAVKEGSPSYLKALELSESLEAYPVLNEDELSEKEHEEANRIWKDCYSKKERLKYIRENRSQFEFHDFKDLLLCVRGEYFAGYASELIY